MSVEVRRGRPWAVVRFASRLRVGDHVHLTSVAGEVVERSVCDPTFAYPDGYVEVLVAHDGVHTRFRFGPSQEVLMLGPSDRERWEAWRTGDGPVRDTLTVPPAVAKANGSGRLF